MNTPLKVMQLVLGLGIGGAEKLVCDIVRQVDKQLVHSCIYCLNDNVGHFGEALQEDGYHVGTLGREPGVDWKLIPKLSTILQQEKIDIIHAHQYSPHFYGLMASLLSQFGRGYRRPKLIVTEHGKTYFPPQKKLKRVIANPFLSLFTDEIVTISEHTKSILVKYENYPSYKIKVVYNGIDLNRFTENVDVKAKKESLGLPLNRKIIGIVSRLAPIKNHAMLLRAFKQVAEQVPETSLLIVGDGPEAQNLRTLADSLRLSENISFLGAREDVPELLRIFDVFALTSFSEGMSVSLLEAMGASVPIVATRVGGNPEVINNGETGYLVQSDREHEMAAMLLKLLQNEKLRCKMGLAGQQRVSSMFSLHQMVNTYTEMYLKHSVSI